jgi:hypothetical protein
MPTDSKCCWLCCADSASIPYKFVVVKVGCHARVFPAYRTIDNFCASSLCDGTRRPDCHRAMNDRKTWIESLNISSSFADKVIDSKRVTDMHDIDIACCVGWRRHVDSDRIVVPRNDLEERFPYFP